MGNLAFVGSHKVNGVSALHTESDAQDRVPRLCTRSIPAASSTRPTASRFRRWLIEANPGLTALLIETLGERVLDDLDALERLARIADDPALAASVRGRQAREQGRARARDPRALGIASIRDALFDVQVKRIHEYKRQLLNMLETIALYDAIRAEPDERLGAARQDLRRQGGRQLRQAKLIIKLDQRRRAASSIPTRPCAAC